MGASIRAKSFVCLVAAELFRHRLENAQFGEGLFDPAFAVPELVVACAQVQVDPWADVGADRLGVFDAGLARTVLVLTQLCDGLVDRGLPDLVRTFDDRHSGAEVDSGVADCSVVDEANGMKSHEPLLANRKSRPSAS